MLGSVRHRAPFGWRRFGTTFTPPLEWNESSIITDRKSKFQARCVPLSSAAHLPLLVAHLAASDRTMRKATHVAMLAWRTGEAAPVPVPPPRGKHRHAARHLNLQQGYDDCGESGAGQRLLLVLESLNLVNVCVVVTRWYGGTPLGSARFRHISVCARESLLIGGFGEGGKGRR